MSALLAVPALLGTSLPAQAQQVIAHAGLDTSEISRNQARLLFTMRLPQWPDQVPVRVFVLPDAHPLHARFTNSVLGLFPYQLRRVWDRQVFSGTGQAPTTVADEAEMVQAVARHRGAIGYIGGDPDRYPGVKRLEVR